MRETVFKFLEDFLTKLGPEKAYNHCNYAVDTCLFAFKCEESNPTKAATFLPLHCILQWDTSVIDNSTCSELAKTYQNAYQRVKTLTGSVKGDILQTLGLLSDIQVTFVLHSVNTGCAIMAICKT